MFRSPHCMLRHQASGSRSDLVLPPVDLSQRLCFPGIRLQICKISEMEFTLSDLLSVGETPAWSMPKTRVDEIPPYLGQRYLASLCCKEDCLQELWSIDFLLECWSLQWRVEEDQTLEDLRTFCSDPTASASSVAADRLITRRIEKREVQSHCLSNVLSECPSLAASPNASH